eukprot:3063514-Prymnesium_polylepis.1
MAAVEASAEPVARAEPVEELAVTAVKAVVPWRPRKRASLPPADNADQHRTRGAGRRAKQRPAAVSLARVPPSLLQTSTNHAASDGTARIVDGARLLRDDGNLHLVRHTRTHSTHGRCTPSCNGHRLTRLRDRCAAVIQVVDRRVAHGSIEFEERNIIIEAL